MTALTETLLALACLAVLARLAMRIAKDRRRRQSDDRRREAALTLLRDEMDANLFAIMSLSRNLEDLSDTEDGERVIQLQTDADGTQFLYLEDDSADYRSAYPIRPVETTAARAQLLLAAEIAPDLFASLGDYIGLMREVERIRKDLVDHLKGQHGGPARISEFFFEDMVVESRKRLIRIEERLRLLQRSIYGVAAIKPQGTAEEAAERLNVKPPPPRTTPQ